LEKKINLEMKRRKNGRRNLEELVKDRGLNGEKKPRSLGGAMWSREAVLHATGSRTPS